MAWSKRFWTLTSSIVFSVEGELTEPPLKSSRSWCLGGGRGSELAQKLGRRRPCGEKKKEHRVGRDTAGHKVAAPAIPLSRTFHMMVLFTS